MPVQLYRLLRLSTLYPELGFKKLIRWTKDGNGIHIVDESRFMKKIVLKISKISKGTSFRTALGQYNFSCTKSGRNSRGGIYRILKHRSIEEAERTNDPSKRFFYAGISLDVLLSMKTRIEEIEMRRTKNSRLPRMREKVKRDEENRAKGKYKDGSSKEAKSLSIRVGSGRNEREQRRTKDGCLHPKDGAEQLLLEDGTYEKPRGARPLGLFWDEFRGLWAPPHLVTTEPKKDLTEGQNNNDIKTKRKKDFHPSTKRNIRLTTHTNDDETTSTKSRLMSDGCLLPKRKPYRFDDGRYKKPQGSEPKALAWDEIRGLWAPPRKKRKLGSETSVSSSSDDDTTIIKASKANLFHHSSSIVRATYLQPKNRKIRHHSSFHSKSFQARTKSNPSGIVHHAINLSNWRKIEELMKRSRQQRNMVAAAPVVTSNSFGDEGEVRLV